MSLENKWVLILRHEILKIFLKQTKLSRKLNNGVIWIRNELPRIDNINGWQNGWEMGQEK